MHARPWRCTFHCRHICSPRVREGAGEHSTRGKTQTQDWARRPSGVRVVLRADTVVRLQERVRALEREMSDVAAGAERVREEAEVEAEAWAVERARFEEDKR